MIDNTTVKHSINIDARRWFDKQWGNTYHSVSVSVDGNHIGIIPFASGYGEQYLQSALTLLQGAGIYRKTDKLLPNGTDADYNSLFTDMVNKRHDFYITCSDVSRKRDLHNGGKD